MKLALTMMFASAITRIVWGAPIVAESLWFAAAVQLTWMVHNDIGLRGTTPREIPSAAAVRA